MINPFLTARMSLRNASRATPENPEGPPMSQRDVAADLGVTQAFVQKVEEGLMSTAPDSISYYYDNLLSPNTRIEMLDAIVSEIRELNSNSHLPIKIPRRFVYGNPQFAVPTLGGLYTLYVIYQRAILPDLSPRITMYDEAHVIPLPGKNIAEVTVRDMVLAADPRWRDRAVGDEEPQWAYLLAGLLKINPFIIQRWEKLNKQVPPTLRIAIAQTGRRG